MIGQFAAFHTHVHMKPENEIAARRLLQLVNNFVVTHMVGCKLAFPMAERMGTGSAQFQIQPNRNIMKRFAQQRHIFIRLIYILANIGAYFHYSLVHFCFYFIFYHLLPFVHNFLLVAFQLQGVFVKHHVLFFHSQCKTFIINSHV